MLTSLVLNKTVSIIALLIYENAKLMFLYINFEHKTLIKLLKNILKVTTFN